MSNYKFKKGDKVMLHEHQEVNGHKNWSNTMNKWIGKEATLTILYGGDDDECLCWYTDLTEVFVWREVSMTLIDTVGGKSVKTQASGCKCTRCLEWYEYAVPVDNFTCYGCRH